MAPTPEELVKERRSEHHTKIHNWLTPEGLALLEGLSRDGYGLQDIATRLDVSLSTIRRWRRDYQAIDESLSRGREVADYMVENALFKTALGYRSKEVSIQTKMVDGIVTEVVKDVRFKDQAPNVRAIETWLYNRKPNLWKRDGGSRLDELIGDSAIQITVNKGLPKEEDNSWGEEVNTDITINKPTNNDNDKKTKTTKKEPKTPRSHRRIQTRESTFDEYNAKREIQNAMPSDNIKVNKKKSLDEAINTINNREANNSISKEKDLDEWPDDWEDQLNGMYADEEGA